MGVTGHEAEFRRLFADEARERLVRLAEAALALEERGPEPALVDAMFREAHTLKGGAGVVGFGAIAQVVHDLEEVIESLREGEAMRPGTPDAILATVDTLREMIGEAMAEVGPPSPEPGQAIVRRPVAPPPAPEVHEAIAVPVERLDEIVRLVGESAIAQLRVGHLLTERLGREASNLEEYRQLARVLQTLQERAMRARMVSVETIGEPLRRAVRELGREAGKEVRWELHGGETELDRHVLEALREPLVALVRNAVAHGVEPPGERRASGKAPVGVVSLHARQLGADVVIAVRDDGRGIDVDRVRAAAGPAVRTDAEALEAIFAPGLTTDDEVSGISGRGVGLDAVRSTVTRLRGRVEVASEPGAGTEVRITVPLTLAVLRCLLVESGGERWAIPSHAAVSVLAPEAADGLDAEGRPAVWSDRESVAVTDLSELVGGAAAQRGPLVVLAGADGRHAFRVARSLAQQDVLVSELSPLLGRLPLVVGAGVDPYGAVLPILDPGGLVAAAGAAPVRAAARAAARQAQLEAPAEAPARILVVDDALTIRELQRAILTRAGFEVVTAAGGEEALARLAEDGADLVLTDVEMPGMDGFALTEAIRAVPRHAGLPVLILSSRSDETDRRRGLESGADGYLVKSTFDEQALLAAVGRLLGERTRTIP